MRNIEARVTDVIADQFEIPAADISPNMDVFTAYSGDEADTLEIVIKLECEFGTRLNGDIAERCRTPRSFANLVTNALF